MDLMEQALRAEIELLKDLNLEEQMQRARTLVEIFEENPTQKGTRAEARARMRLRLCQEAYIKRGLTIERYDLTERKTPTLATFGDFLVKSIGKDSKDARHKRREGLEGRNRPR